MWQSMIRHARLSPEPRRSARGAEMEVNGQKVPFGVFFMVWVQIASLIAGHRKDI